MNKWLSRYQDEALECESIILATILNPRFRGKFFRKHYPEEDISANLTIETAFNSLLEETNEADEPSPSPENNMAPTDTTPDAFDIFGVSNSGTKGPCSSELDSYLEGKYPMKKDQTPLSWWKVR